MMEAVKSVLKKFFIRLGLILGAILAAGAFVLLVSAGERGCQLARTATQGAGEKIEKDKAEEACKPHKMLTKYEHDGKKFVVCLGHEVREVKK